MSNSKTKTRRPTKPLKTQGASPPAPRSGLIRPHNTQCQTLNRGLAGRRHPAPRTGRICLDLTLKWLDYRNIQAPAAPFGPFPGLPLLLQHVSGAGRPSFQEESDKFPLALSILTSGPHEMGPPSSGFKPSSAAPAPLGQNGFGIPQSSPSDLSSASISTGGSPSPSPSASALSSHSPP